METHILDTMLNELDPDLFLLDEDELTERANRFDIETSLESVAEWPNPPRMKVEGVEEQINRVDCLYIDNEDGFWDDYLEWKEEQYSANDVIYSRPFFKH